MILTNGASGRPAPGIRRPQVLLKARPLARQLADRLAAPEPDGVELYIHEQDVSGDGWLDRIRAAVEAVPVPSGFTWIVEGPVWALDGELAGLCRNDESDRELVRRLVTLARTLGAPAVNIHCVEGSPDPAVVAPTRQAETLTQARPFLRWYVQVCQAAGLQPLIENVPPICRMRRSAFIFSPIGVAPEDLVACVEAAPGLGITLDTSHAQLAVNAFRGVAPPSRVAGSTNDEVAALHQAAGAYRAMGGPTTLEAYIAPLLPWVVNVHISNAAGLLDEGAPYDQGDADLDAAVRQLAPQARYFVTEPLDPDEDHAVQKRAIQQHLFRVLGTANGSHISDPTDRAGASQAGASQAGGTLG